MLPKHAYTPTKEKTLKPRMTAATSTHNMRCAPAKHVMLVPSHVPWQLYSCTTVDTSGMYMMVVDSLAVDRSTCGLLSVGDQWVGAGRCWTTSCFAVQPAKDGTA